MNSNIETAISTLKHINAEINKTTGLLANMSGIVDALESIRTKLVADDTAANEMNKAVGV